jgi:DNA-binding response OmpR family regulator
VRTENTIWILEDDPGACFVYQETLGFRYNIEIFNSIRQFSDRIVGTTITPQLIIADLRLPDGMFLDLLGEEKPLQALNVPFVIISSSDDLDILRECFKEGALDYLTKPFTKNELIVKTERILFRSRKFPLLKPEITLDPMTLKVTKAGKESVQLTAKEHHIFSLLYQSQDEMISRKTLQIEVWADTRVSEKTLDVHILHLRRKLADIGLKISFIAPDSFKLLSEA